MFRVGDRVRFKTWEQMVGEYGMRGWSNSIACIFGFTEYMRHLCGTCATIREISGDYIFLRDFENPCDTNWDFSKDMLELVDSETPSLDKIKVGDFVVANEKASDTYCVTKKGWKGVVVQIDEPYITVLGINNPSIDYSSICNEKFQLREEYLDILKKGE